MAEETFEQAFDYVEVESYFESDWTKYKRACKIVIDNRDLLPRCVSIVVPDESVSDDLWLKIRANSDHMCGDSQCSDGERCSGELERFIHSPDCKHGM